MMYIYSIFSLTDFQILNLDVGKKLYKLSKFFFYFIFFFGGGNLDKIQKNSSFFSGNCPLVCLSEMSYHDGQLFSTNIVDETQDVVLSLT